MLPNEQQKWARQGIMADDKGKSREPMAPRVKDSRQDRLNAAKKMTCRQAIMKPPQMGGLASAETSSIAALRFGRLRDVDGSRR
jgi:hypothetical protein